VVQDGQTIDSNARRRFAAFISYAHADAAIAGKLQSRLERYRLPKHIAAAHADGKAALGQIFRDREDLAAAPSLSDAIRAAIAEAEALVVLCSPDAKASRWVGEEIALFRALHPDRPILAALVRGEPDEAFPAALTQGGNEPLAADLRKEGDGEALGFLKIVAGIAGVPLDTLVQRDAQRRIRRVMWITGAALAAMLVMGIMTAFAIQARNEAARQRAEAEGLVEYMLTDLREKLKGVGRLDVMEGVNKRAKEYYGNGSVKSRVLDAQVLHAMGEDLEKQGQIDKAQERFNAAYHATAELLNSHPKNPDAIFTHAQSEYWMGFAAWRKPDIETAGRHWREYLQHAQSLAKTESGTVRSSMELGYAHGNMCELLMNKERDVKGGIDHCRKAVGFMRQAVAIDPKNTVNLKALSNRLGWLADALVTTQAFDEAVEHRNTEQRIVDSLVATDPRNVEYQVRQTWPQIGLGKIAEKRGQTDLAMRHYSVALRRLDRLTVAFAEDFSVLEYRIRANILMARTLRTANRANWRTYRDQAAALIANTRISNDKGLPRMSAMLAKFDGEK
jgi:tetratricopeptide (TPR) repeat protein